MKNVRLSEGFRGQVLHFTPVNLRSELARHPLGSGLYVPDLGWFPRAYHHYRERSCGAEEHILIYCRAGGGWFEIDGRLRKVSRGQALLIPSGKAHRYGADALRPWSIYWAHFAGATAAVYSSHFQSTKYLLPVAADAGQRVEHLFRECYRTLSTGASLGNLLFVAHTFRHLLGVLLFSNSAFRENKNSLSPHDFAGSLELMHRNLSRMLTLRELARQAGLSSSRYSALFKAQIGVSPVEYHISLRIQAACRLLITTALSVKEISNRLGYRDPYYFSRIFGKTMGVSPSSYRCDAKG